MAPTQVVGRSVWERSTNGDRFSRRLQPNRVRGIVLHYPGDGGGSRAGLDVAGVSRLLRGYQAFHRHTRGWPDIGYLLGVDQAGRLYHLAGAVVGAHSATRDYPAANHERVGVLLVLGDNERPSPEMTGTVIWLREALPAGRVAGFPALPGCHDLHGHTQMPGAGTRCPGPHVLRMVGDGSFTVGGRPAGVSTGSQEPTRERNSSAKRTYEKGAVARIQRLLQMSGFYTGALDDDYGPRTAEAVTSYQRGQRWPLVTVDGDWGPWMDAHANWTRDLQIALNGWRSALPALHVDWDYGDLTWQRVKEWQTRNRGGAYKGVPDGAAGPLTVKALGVRPHP